MFLLDWKEDEKMKNINRLISNTQMIQTADGKFGYLKNLSKYYLTCISYLPNEVSKSLKSNQESSNSLKTGFDKNMLAEERYRQEIVTMFERICNNSAKVGDKVYAIDFIKRNSLEYLVQIIIPKEFDDVYTVLNNYSALEINYLIRDLKRILGNGDKVSVISDYLSYCLDDKKIKENMSKDFMKTDLSRVKVIH